MANGTEPGFKMPGVFVGGGFGISTTALAIIGLGAAAWAYFNWERKDRAKLILREEMKPANIENKIEQDVIANAAFTETALNNQDRIREAIRRMEPRLRELRNNYRDGILSRDEFVAEMRGAWQTISSTLGIPTKPPSQIPEINKGHRGGSWRRAFRNFN
jgi:hypothetical protein